MPTEMALLADVEPGSVLIADIAEASYPDASVLEYRRGRIRQVIDAEGTALLMIYRAQPIADPREAGACLRGVPGAFRLWIDLAIPFTTPSGRGLAHEIARAIGGVVYERV